MSENNKLRQRTEALRTLAALALFTKDSYSNPGAKLGIGQPNLMNMSEYPLQRLTRDWQLMTSLYRNDWICKRIIDTPAEDMTRAWVKINSQIDPDLMKRFDNVVKAQHVRDRIQNALKWARLYGGSGAVIMIKGHEDIMDQPLELDTIMPGSFGGLIVLDRWDGIQPTGELVEELGDPEFGQPAYYNIGGQAFGGVCMRVHYSRVLPFRGRELPIVEEVGENYWGASEMEHIFEELNKRNTSSANIAQLLFQANLRVLKTGDLAEQLATLDPEAMKEIYQVAQAQNELMSSFGLQFLDAGDSFETHSYTFAGISDVYKTFMSDIAGAAEIPATKLFGRSPEGMNSTGESDLTNYYDAINAKQERILRPALEKLFPVICVSCFGAIPDDFDFEFNSVRSSSEAERADLAKNIIDSVLAAYNSEIVDKATVLQELRKSSAATGLFTSITDEQIDAAKQEALMAAQQPQIPGAEAIGVQPGEGLPGGEAQPMQGMEMQQGQMPMQTMDAWAEDDRWVTLEGGTHVRLDKDNRMTKAPKGLKGKTVGEVSSPNRNTFRKQGTGGRKDKDSKSTAQKYGSTTGENRFRGFAKTRLKQHSKSHMAEVGAANERDYEKKAREFGSLAVGGNIAGGRDGEGNIVRYDKENCILFTGNPQTGFIHTFMLVKKGKKKEAENYVKKNYPDIDLG